MARIVFSPLAWIEGTRVETPRPKIAKILRVLFRTAKWTIGILAGLIAGFVAVNVFDEDPSPETRALLVAPPNPYTPEQNLYLALLGFEAPHGKSSLEIAQERIARYERGIAAALKDPASADLYSQITWQERESLTFQGKVDFCQPLNGSCVAEVEHHRPEIERLLKINRELLGRYSNLHQLSGYYETTTPSIYSVIAFVPSPVRQLYLANVALLVKTGVRSQQRAALASLREDIATWRNVLIGNGSLISKMIAVASLQGDYIVLADIIATNKFDPAESSREILAALDVVKEDDWKVGSVFAYEFRLSAYLWDQLRIQSGLRLPESSPEDGQWWQRFIDQVTTPFLKFNATQNLQAKEAAQLKRMGDAAPEAFFATRDALRKWRAENLDLGLHSIYNPAGKVLIGVASVPYESYVLRARDGEAFLRLVRLGYEIRTRKIRDELIPSFMQQHPDWATHPVDGRPFVWIPERREIAVQTLGDQPEGRRFKISVRGTAPAR
jgi:hypothetical protein